MPVTLVECCQHGRGHRFRQTRSVRPVFQFVSVVVLLLCFSTAGWAPDVGLAEPEEVKSVALSRPCS